MFLDCRSDRALNSMDEYTSDYPSDLISRLYLVGNGDSVSALYDDIYLSKSGYNATTPIAAGYAGPPPACVLQKSGNQWQIVFEGKLLQSTSLNGGWTEVTGATSPYPVSATGPGKYYRAACN